MTYLEITDKATHVVSTSAAKLHGVLITAAGTSWTLAIYDGLTASDPVVASAFTVGAAGTYYNFGDVFLAGGLTMVTAGTTAGTMTVFYES